MKKKQEASLPNPNCGICKLAKGGERGYCCQSKGEKYAAPALPSLRRPLEGKQLQTPTEQTQFSDTSTSVSTP